MKPLAKGFCPWAYRLLYWKYFSFFFFCYLAVIVHKVQESAYAEISH